MFITNTLVFITGMAIAFFVAISFMNSNFLTANIGDAFQSSSGGNNKTISLFTDEQSYLHITTIQNIMHDNKKSIRITLLYNPQLQEKIFSLLSSSYQYSIALHSGGMLSLLMNLTNQDILAHTDLITINAQSLSSENIPVIKSVELFDADTVDNLVLHNLPSLWWYH